MTGARARGMLSLGQWLKGILGKTAKGDGNLECQEKWFKLHLEALGTLKI